MNATTRFRELTVKCLAAPFSELADCSYAVLAQAERELGEREQLFRQVAKLVDSLNRKVASESGGTFSSLSEIFERNCDDFRRFVHSSCDLWLFHSGSAWDFEPTENFEKTEHVAERIDRIDATICTYRDLLPDDLFRTF